MRCLPVPQTRTQLAHGPMLLNAARAGMCRPPIDLACVAVFFRLSSWELWLLIVLVVGGASALGVLAGRLMRANSERHREPIGALQGALLGVVGLILAFGLSLAVGRYQDRRADVVTDANTIGTAYLRAQTIAEPQRTARSRASAATTIWRSASRTRSPAARPSGPRRRSRAGCNAPSGDSLARASTHTRATRRRASTSTA